MVINQLIEELGQEELETLVELGPWVARLVAQHPSTSDSTLGALAASEDARIRFALIQNPAIGDDILAILEAGSNPDIAAAAKVRRYSSAPANSPPGRVPNR